MHDLRQRGETKWKPLCTLNGHSNSINGASISPDGQFLVSVGQDDTIKIWRNFMDSSKKEMKSYRHNNKTGRWLSTFRPEFDPKHPHAFWLGSMLNHPRRFELHVALDEVVEMAPSTNGSKKRKNPTAAMQSEGEFGLHPSADLTAEKLSSICSRFCVHPTRDVIAGANSSGKVHLFR